MHCIFEVAKEIKFLKILHKIKEGKKKEEVYKKIKKWEGEK